MKLEYLLLVKNDDSFCNSEKAFIDFLKVDSLITISGKKLSYKKSSDLSSLITVNFRVETGNIPSGKERYFLIVLETDKDDLIEEFSELGDKIKQISKKINPESAVINTLWDDVGRVYASQSYPIINEVENLMRKLISKFMLINVGVSWSKESLHPDLFKKIESYEDEGVSINDLSKLDFIHLSHVLFQKKRDMGIEDLDRILAKKNISPEDIENIRKYAPVSNWDKYFSALLGDGAKGLEMKWGLLYKLRNQVAHNRFIRKDEFKKINGLANEVKIILEAAINKLGEIDLSAEEREIMKNSYSSESLAYAESVIEQSVANYYLDLGFKIDSSYLQGGPDFIIKTPNELMAVEIKSVSASPLNKGLLKLRLHSAYSQVVAALHESICTRAEIIIVLKDIEVWDFSAQISVVVQSFKQKLDSHITVIFGLIDKNNKLCLIDI